MDITAFIALAMRARAYSFNFCSRLLCLDTSKLLAG